MELKDFRWVRQCLTHDASILVADAHVSSGLCTSFFRLVVPSILLHTFLLIVGLLLPGNISNFLI